MGKPTENSTKISKRPVGRPFEKGRSGNPGGRPKLPDDVKAMFSNENNVAVLSALLETALDRDHHDHVRACGVWLERSMGKVVQRIANADGSPLFRRASELTDEELFTAASEVLRRRTNNPEPQA